MNKNTILLSLLFFFGAHAAHSQGLSAPGEYIVKYRVRPNIKGGLKVGSRLSSGEVVKNLLANSKMLHVRVETEAERQTLFANAEVEFVEPNFIVSLDPVSLEQSASEYTQTGAKPQVKESWTIQKPAEQGAKTIVAIIDTGLDNSHLLFSESESIWENTAEKNGRTNIDDDGNGFIDDVNGWNFFAATKNFQDDNNHGTHVAGIVLGVGQDVQAYPVQTSKIKIMPLKFMNASGSGSTADAIKAIYYAVDHGAKVINNSWGSGSFSRALDEAYKYAEEKGVLMVSAAGNANKNNDVVPVYPSNLTSANNIAVMAVDNEDSKAIFSNYGAIKVDAAAPGVGVLSSIPGSGCLAPGCFQAKSGTSMATPFVAGVVALLMREAPQLSAQQIKNILIDSADVINGLAGKVKKSVRVNVYKAIVAAQALSPDLPQLSPATSPVIPPAGIDTPLSEVSGNAGSAGAGCGLVKSVLDDSGPGPGGNAMLLSLCLMPLLVLLKLRTSEKQTLIAIK